MTTMPLPSIKKKDRPMILGVKDVHQAITFVYGDELRQLIADLFESLTTKRDYVDKLVYDYCYITDVPQEIVEDYPCIKLLNHDHSVNFDKLKNMINVQYRGKDIVSAFCKGEVILKDDPNLVIEGNSLLTLAIRYKVQSLLTVLTSRFALDFGYLPGLLESPFSVAVKSGQVRCAKSFSSKPDFCWNWKDPGSEFTYRELALRFCPVCLPENQDAPKPKPLLPSAPTPRGTTRTLAFHHRAQANKQKLFS